MAKIKDVAECFLFLDDSNDGDGISNLKLQKLVYYAQGFFTAIYDKPLFQSRIYAWAHGPVVPSLYHTYKVHGRNSITVPANFDPKSLKGDEFDLIEEVFLEFGQFSAWKLRNMTHEESPWMNHEGDISLIPLIEIKEYFKTRLS